MKKNFLFLFLFLIISSNSTSPIIPECIMSLFSPPKITTKEIGEFFFNNGGYTGHNICTLHENCDNKKWHNKDSHKDKFTNKPGTKINPVDGVAMNLEYDPDKNTYYLTTTVNSSNDVFTNESILRTRLLKGVNLICKNTAWRCLDNNTCYKEEECHFVNNKRCKLIYKTFFTKEEYIALRDECEQAEK